jgi:hypothetical protein
MAVTPLLQVETGSIAGIVHKDDVLRDGHRHAGESASAGVVVELLSDVEMIASTQTDAVGQYRFDSIWPGTYSIRDARTGQTLFDVEVRSGQDLTGFDFSESPAGNIAAAFAVPEVIGYSAPSSNPFPFVPPIAVRPASEVILALSAREEYFPNSVDGESQPWRLSLLKPQLSKAGEKVMHPASLHANPLRSGKWIVGDEELSFGLDGGIPLVGDFNGDGQDELGVYLDGQWLLDANSNRRVDDGDMKLELGTHANQPAVGDWDGDGDDDIGVYASQAAQPIAGDFAGHGRDVIGLFQSGTWQLDANGDGQLTSADPTLSFGAAGDTPVVGDFDGDGRDEIGVFRNGQWIIDSNHTGQIDAADKVFELGGAGDVPIVGDFDGDGIDEPGLYRGSPAARISRTR